MFIFFSSSLTSNMGSSIKREEASIDEHSIDNDDGGGGESSAIDDWF
jgi:hypothetical protein